MSKTGKRNATFCGLWRAPFLSGICKSVCFLAIFSEADACEGVPAPIGSADRPYSASRTMIASQYYSKSLRRGTVPSTPTPGGLSPFTAPNIGYTPPSFASCDLYRPHRGNASPSARAPRGSSLRFSFFFMSLSPSALIGSSMRSIQLDLYRQAAPGRPLLPFGGSGSTVRSPMRLSALANQAPCSVSPSAFYASENPSANSLSSSMQIQQIR